MIYTYTTYALETQNGVLIFLGFIISLLIFGFLVLAASTMESQYDTHSPLKTVGHSALFGIVVSSIIVFDLWSSPYPNEKVTATMVETGDAQYKSGKSSYVKGATVTYLLPDGGLVTFRTDNGAAWYPEIILYKNPKR